MLFVLADFSVIKPTFGLLFWSTVFFLLFWFLIGKFAFKPIAKALKKREDDIQGALNEAKKARDEMSNLKAENEALMAETRAERAKILKEATDTKNAIVNEAKTKAKEEAQKVLNNAKVEIENQKNAAMVEVKNSVGTMAIDIAEKLIQKDLKGNAEHVQYVDKLVKEINLN